MISRQNSNLGLCLNPHLLNDLPSFPQQTTHMHSRHHKSRRNPLLPTTHHQPKTLLAGAGDELVGALEDPVVDEEQRLLRRRERRHSPVRVPPARVGDLDDPLLVPGDQLVHVDPRAGVLPDRLDDAPGLPDHPSGLHVVAQNPVRRRHGQRRVRLRLRGSTRPAPVTVVRRSLRCLSRRRRVVVVVPRSRPTYRLGIIVLVIVVVPLRS